jgi:beta-lactam-binding protein with PASTA domain
VVGQEYRKGESLLKEKGLGMRVLGLRWDQNQPVGIIFDQNPLAGERVVLGYTVTVTIGGKPGQALPSPGR